MIIAILVAYVAAYVAFMFLFLDIFALRRYWPSLSNERMGYAVSTVSTVLNNDSLSEKGLKASMRSPTGKLAVILPRVLLVETWLLWRVCKRDGAGVTPPPPGRRLAVGTTRTAGFTDNAVSGLSVSNSSSNRVLLLLPRSSCG